MASERLKTKEHNQQLISKELARHLAGEMVYVRQDVYVHLSEIFGDDPTYISVVDSIPVRSLDEIKQVLTDEKAGSYTLTAQDAAVLILAGHGAFVAERFELFDGVNAANVAAWLIRYDLIYDVVDNISTLSVNYEYPIVEDPVLRQLCSREERLELLRPDFPVDGGYRLMKELQMTPGEMIQYLDCFSDMADFMDEVREQTGLDWLQEYPREGTAAQKDHWYGDIASRAIAPGFNRAAFGALIRAQIEQGYMTLRDVSSYLTVFDTPDTAIDVGILHNYRAQQGIISLDRLEPITLIDRDKEEDFFVALLDAPYELRSRILLSSKSDAAHLYFDYPAHTLLYSTLLQKDDEGIELYRRPELTLELLLEAALDQRHQLAELTYRDKRSAIMTVEEVTNEISEFAVGAIAEKCERVHETQKVSEIMSELKQLGLRRQEYFRDAERWLLRQRTTPIDTLTAVWHYRADSLVERSVPDNAIDITVQTKLNWYCSDLCILQEHGIISAVDVGWSLQPNQIATFRHLARYFSYKDSACLLASLFDYQQSCDWQPEEKLVPMTRIMLESSGGVATHYFDVIGPDDPRGFTIGEDTDCCMTFDGLASSCIEAGYSQKNAGFMALYEAKRDKLIAQSFWYVHPDFPDVLIIDSIEITAGRDFNKIWKQYAHALETILQNSDSKIREVRLGDVEVTESRNYSGDELIPPLEGVYSDATEVQGVLLARAT